MWERECLCLCLCLCLGLCLFLLVVCQHFSCTLWHTNYNSWPALFLFLLLCWRMLTYVDVMVTYADIVRTYSDIWWRMLTYADVCWQGLTCIPLVQTSTSTSDTWVTQVWVLRLYEGSVKALLRSPPALLRFSYDSIKAQLRRYYDSIATWVYLVLGW